MLDAILLDLVVVNTPTKDTLAGNVVNSREFNGSEIDGKEGQSDKRHVSRLYRWAAVVTVVVKESYGGHSKCWTHRVGDVVKGITLAKYRRQNCGENSYIDGQ